MFNWAIEAGDYGLEYVPVRSPSAKASDRRADILAIIVMNDAEDPSSWNAAKKKISIRSVLLVSPSICSTGVRKTEAPGSQWPEFDLDR